VVAKVGTSKRRGKAMATPKNLSRMQCGKSHIGSMTGLWFLADWPLGLNTNEWMNIFSNFQLTVSVTVIQTSLIFLRNEVIIQNSCNINQVDALISLIYFWNKTPTVPLSIIGRFSLYTQQWYMSYSLRVGSGWNFRNYCI